MRNRITMFAVPLAFLLLIALFCQQAMDQPYYHTGMSFRIGRDGYRVTVVAPGSAASMAGFRAGMLLVRIDGRAVGELWSLTDDRYLPLSSRFFRFGEAFSAEDAQGTVHSFTVVRDPAARRAVRDSTVLRHGLIGAGFVLIGAWLFAVARKAFTVRRFLFFGCMAGAAIAVSYFSAYWSWPMLLVRFVAFDVFGVAAGVSLTLFFRGFPGREPMAAGAWARALLLAASASTLLAVKYVLLAVMGWSPFGPLLYFVHVFLLGSFLFSGLTVLRQWKKSGPTDRRRILWMLMGSGLGLLPYTVYLLFLLLRGSVLGASLDAWAGVSSVAFVLFPLSVATAAVRHRLFDIDRLIAPFLSFLAALALLMALLAGAWAALRFDPGAGYSVLLAGAAAVLSPPVYLGVRRRMEAVLFPRHPARRDAVLALEKDLIAGSGESDIRETVARRLMAAYDAAFVCIAAREDGGGLAPLHVASAPGADVPLETLFSQRASTPPDRPLRHGDGTLSIPLPRRDGQAGCLFLGPQRTADAYTKADVALLGSTAFQISQALENAVLTRSLGDSVRRLSQEGAERMQAEAALRESERKLLEAQKLEAVGRLAGGIAHDFNNVLTAVIGQVELILMEENLTDGVRSRVRAIRESARRASALIRRILSFSRRQAAAMEVFALNPFLAGLEEMVARLVGEQISVQVTLDPAAGTIQADPGQVEQILLNLVVNARDAMPAGGTLSIRTGREEDGPPAEGGPQGRSWTVLEVEDDGCGMSREVQGRIFEPFFTTKEPGKGTGLGLCTVRQVVEQVHGTIRVESAPCRGARFTIRFPSAGEEEGAAAGEAETLPRGTETILLAEDEKAVRDLVQEILSGLGYTVMAAGGGREAGEILHRPGSPGAALLITDVVMPGMSGPALARLLTMDRPRMRVLLISGYAEDHALSARDGPDFPFLRKPFTPSELARKVRDILDGP